MGQGTVAKTGYEMGEANRHKIVFIKPLSSVPANSIVVHQCIVMLIKLGHLNKVSIFGLKHIEAILAMNLQMRRQNLVPPA